MCTINSNNNLFESLIETNTRICGTVDWFRSDKGYGVINVINNETNKNESIFVYYTNILHSTPLIPFLHTGEVVEFNVFKSFYNNTMRYHAKDVLGCNGRKLMFEKYYDAQNKEIQRTTRIIDPDSVVTSIPHININLNIPNVVKSTDLIILNNHFDDISADDIISEINELHLNSKQIGGIWKMWHGDTHLIADDLADWKSSSLYFKTIVKKTADLFNIDVKATRLNMFVGNDYKPYHQDAAAFKMAKAIDQNFSINISFGEERKVYFRNNKTNTIVAINLPNGTIYAFGKDVNLYWQHGIPPAENAKERASIVLWGYKEQINS